VHQHATAQRATSTKVLFSSAVQARAATQETEVLLRGVVDNLHRLVLPGRA
jgi:hypothetical protein